MINFHIVHPHGTLEMLGFIPEFLDERNPAPAKEQLHHNYVHGGGWRPMKGFKFGEPIAEYGGTPCLVYPGDPPIEPIAKAMLRDETIIVYNWAWVAIVQKDGSYEVARMD